MAKSSSFYFLIGAMLYTIIIIALYIVVFLFDLQTIAFKIFTNLNILSWGLIACILFMLVVRQFTLQTPPGKVWFFLMIGIFLWWVGDFYWMINEVIVQAEELFPSPADYIYLAGYFPMYGALLYQLRLFPSKLTKKERFIIGGILSIIFILFTVFLIIPILQTPIDEEFTLTQLFFSLFYPIGDLILAGITLVFLFKLQGGEYQKVYRLVAFGFLIYIVADFLFTWFEWQETPNHNLIEDHFYYGSSIFLASAALFMREMLRKK